MNEKEKLLSDAVDVAERALAAAEKALWNYRVEQAPFKIDSLIRIRVGSGEVIEAKVVGAEGWCGQIRPRAVPKKRDGTWSIKPIPVWRIDDFEVVA